jgi:hypothetical protein
MGIRVPRKEADARRKRKAPRRAWPGFSKESAEVAGGQESSIPGVPGRWVGVTAITPSSGAAGASEQPWLHRVPTR